VKAVTSTTKNKASNNDDDESRGDTNDDDSNSVDAKKRNGKPSSTDAGASGIYLNKIFYQKFIFMLLGDLDESGDYDEEDDDNSDEDGRFN
jgi:hypothetical protein